MYINKINQAKMSHFLKDFYSKILFSLLSKLSLILFFFLFFFYRKFLKPLKKFSHKGHLLPACKDIFSKDIQMRKDYWSLFPVS